ncbi:MAG: peptidoglycan-binding domain-containing protein, partial [Maricaulaceae bacterium]
MSSASGDGWDPRQRQAHEDLERMRAQMQRKAGSSFDPLAKRAQGLVTPSRAVPAARTARASGARLSAALRSLSGGSRLVRHLAAVVIAFVGGVGLIGLFYTFSPAELPMQGEAAPDLGAIVLSDTELGAGGPGALEDALAGAEEETAALAFAAADRVAFDPPLARPEPGWTPQSREVAAVVEHDASADQNASAAAERASEAAALEPRETTRAEVSAATDDASSVLPQTEQAAPTLAQVEQIREIQSGLAVMGYDLDLPDGDAGPQTRAATARFAEARGLADANLDAAFAAAVRAASAEGHRAGDAALEPDNAVVARVAIVRRAQELMNELGYAVGRPDGDPGPLTQRVVADIAAARGLGDEHIDGAFTALLAEAVEAQTADARVVEASGSEPARARVEPMQLAEADPMVERALRIRE